MRWRKSWSLPSFKSLCLKSRFLSIYLLCQFLPFCIPCSPVSLLMFNFFRFPCGSLSLIPEVGPESCPQSKVQSKVRCEGQSGSKDKGKEQRRRKERTTKGESKCKDQDDYQRAEDRPRKCILTCLPRSETSWLQQRGGAAKRRGQSGMG